jgi:hypothetical protein
MRAAALLVVATGTFSAFVGCGVERERPDHVSVEELRRLGVEPGKSDARIAVPPRADGEVFVGSPEGEVSARFVLRGASPIEAQARDGLTVYPQALGGGDLVRVGIDDGFEDLVVFDRAPDREELVYDLDVSHVAGLRLVAHSLELLDGRGAPRLRVERPWIAYAGERREWLDLEIEGCAVDRDARVPWDRPVTSPGATTCRLRIGWERRGVRYPAVVDPTWKLGTSMLPRHDHTTVSFPNGRVAALSGTFSVPATGGNGPSESGQIYDPATKTWGLALSFPGARVEGDAALLGTGRALFHGGGGRSRGERIDANGLITLTSMDTTFFFGPGATLTSLPNGKVLLAGGLNGSASTDAQLYEDDPVDTFTPAGTSPPGALTVARAYHTATRLGSGKVLLAGGVGSGGASLTSAELYDPVANTFTAIASTMSAARARHTATILPGGAVLLAGGGTAKADIYDPVANVFTETTPSSTTRTGARAVVLDSGSILVAGGDGPSSMVEIYDPMTKTWSTQSPMLLSRARFNLARVDQGGVLAFGGLNAAGHSIGAVEQWTPGVAGTTCGASVDCRSGACEEGICCASPCAAFCQTCAPGTGACVTVTSADDPSSCNGTSTCDVTGACKKKNGQTCTAPGECASALCVDGTCCNRACGGQCEACDVPGQLGVCAAVAGTPHGARPACVSGDTTCGGRCNGLLAAECVYASAVTTCASSCSGTEVTTSTCDGTGGCIADVPRPCAGNFVCADGKDCKTTCASSTDCRQGYLCEGGKCLPIALCEERFVTKGSQRIDCYPFTCEQTGACRTSCASVGDCVAPTICSFDGTCIDPPAPASGCSASARRAPSSLSFLFVVLGSALIAARRRRAA